MAQMTLEDILQTIPTLGSAELVQVRQAVQAQLTPLGHSPAEERVLHDLLQAGLLTEIKPRQTARADGSPLVPIQGPPLSETIREERR